MFDPVDIGHRHVRRFHERQSIDRGRGIDRIGGGAPDERPVLERDPGAARDVANDRDARLHQRRKIEAHYDPVARKYSATPMVRSTSTPIRISVRFIPAAAARW